MRWTTRPVSLAFCVGPPNVVLELRAKHSRKRQCADGRQAEHPTLLHRERVIELLLPLDLQQHPVAGLEVALGEPLADARGVPARLGLLVATRCA
ncbi:MAG: hypothetical protein AUG85_04705 [Gemmatimonadetes bacterium 13_1_20CM_4_66_11]|nr:MAG: hypothetical protein AUG85_04705 [Gemmatimonadetes bacterium 13_1_20CM_4_66_11]